jgi:hypothetical protein
MPENVVRAVLEAYTVTGMVGLARRDGNLRYYDLLERLLPAEVLARAAPMREQLRHTLLSRYRAHGLLGAGGAGGTFDRIAPPKSTPERTGRDELHKELVELGALVPVDVEGVRGKRFVLAEELALLEAPPEPMPSVAFIAPFDSLLWDTSFLASLFDFDYVWESFFPPAKRRWGYYVLPISFGDRFVGRIEPRIDRTEPAWRCSTSGGRTASRRAAPKGSSTRCATRSARTCASRAARAASSGHPTSQRKSGSSSSARDERRTAGRRQRDGRQQASRSSRRPGSARFASRRSTVRSRYAPPQKCAACRRVSSLSACAGPSVCRESFENRLDDQ